MRNRLFRWRSSFVLPPTRPIPPPSGWLGGWGKEAHSIRLSTYTASSAGNVRWVSPPPPAGRADGRWRLDFPKLKRLVLKAASEKSIRHNRQIICRPKAVNFVSHCMIRPIFNVSRTFSVSVRGLPRALPTRTTSTESRAQKKARLRTH